MTDLPSVDMTQADDFTIDGLLALHAEHGPRYTAVLSDQQWAYVQRQFRPLGDTPEIREIHTSDPALPPSATSWDARVIYLVREGS